MDKHLLRTPILSDINHTYNKKITISWNSCWRNFHVSSSIFLKISRCYRKSTLNVKLNKWYLCCYPLYPGLQYTIVMTRISLKKESVMQRFDEYIVLIGESYYFNVAFLAATKQLYKWYFPSVRPSISPSVCQSVCLSVTPFSPCSHHRIIMKFSGVITMVKSDFHAKGQGQRSKVKVTEVNTQLSRFRTLTPGWIHIWRWNHAHIWKQHRRGALLFFKVIRQISRSHSYKNRRIWPRLGVSGL